MKICILGMGVIGTAYGYIFQKAGHETEHWVRKEKTESVPNRLTVHVLDGRFEKKGRETEGIYNITLAKPHSAYDFIIVSVACGKLGEAVETIMENGLTGSLLLFCNFWNERGAIDGLLGKQPYMIGFPTAGGRMEKGQLDCVLFDHIMLEGRGKAGISNYDDLLGLLKTSGLKAEIPYDMVEWIWLHMAVNAGVTSTAAWGSSLDRPRQLALALMKDSRALAEAVRTIRETIKTVSARGVDLKKYRSEIMPLRLPAPLAGMLMKRMFAGNRLTRRIMLLHNDVSDILYGCTCIYETAKEKGLDLPGYYKKMEGILPAGKALG